MAKPVDTKDIRITLKSKVLHRNKFDEMGQQFTQQEEKKISLKRKAVLTSTPASKKRSFIQPEASPNVSQVEGTKEEMVQSQASSGYFSQSSIWSDS